MPYNSIILPYGWALCDGLSGRPNLINNFILGGGGTRNIGFTGGAERVTLSPGNIANHSHSDKIANLPFEVRYDTAFSDKLIADGISTFSVTTYGVAQRGNESVTSHENMPPYYVLIYIIKVQSIDFCYNSVALPESPTNVSSTQSGNSVIITWKEPSYDGGTDIIGYKIDNINAGTNILLGPSLRSHTVNSLSYGQYYVFGVATVNRIGSSVSIPTSIFLNS